MRENARIKRITNKIKNLWELNPDYRFFQLLYNFTQLGTRDTIGTVRDPFRYSDNNLEKYIDAYIKECEKWNKKK